MDLNDKDPAAISSRLALIDGVARAIFDAPSGDIVLICSVARQHDDILDEARSALAELGVSKRPRIEVVYRAESREQSRVRFGEMRRQSLAGGVRVDVELEWGEASFAGSATGEPGPALELRTAGQATLNALTSIAGELDLRLAGVKQVKSFDAELVVVSLYAADDPSRKFVGAVVAGSDPLRSAVIAVLSALNRVLGNYLSRS